MRPWISLSFIVVITLAGTPAGLAQQSGCSQQMLQGAWRMTCSGFTDLSKLDPSAPRGTLVPLRMLARTDISAAGTGTGKGVGSVAGMILPFETEETFGVNADCTGEKTYTLKFPDGNSLPGKAMVVFTPLGQDFEIVILEAGDAVSCEYKRLKPYPGLVF